SLRGGGVEAAGARPVDGTVRWGAVGRAGPAGTWGGFGGEGGGGERVDLDGRVVLPGLWDAHVHLTQWALVRRRLDLSGARSAAEAVALVRARLDTDPPAPGTALVGFGFRDALWRDTPMAELLDRSEEHTSELQ